MKNKIVVLTLFAVLLAGFAFKTTAADDTATNTDKSWVSQAVPKPDSDGWITLFDGKHLRGCNPTNDCFKTGKIFVQNGSLWVDSVDIPFNLKAREVAFRVQAKKVSGQNFRIFFSRDVAWSDDGQAFGIGRFVNERYENLQRGKSAARFDDFFEMELLVAGGKILLVADGKTIVKAQDEESMDESEMAIGAFKGISVFKRIEVKLSGVRSMFPEDEAAAGAQPKPDAAERLKKVKALYDQGLINKEDYDKKVKEILDSL